MCPMAKTPDFGERFPKTADELRALSTAGIEAAKKAGVYRGRKPSVPVEKVREMHAAGHGPSAIAKALGISRMSVHRALQRV